MVGGGVTPQSRTPATLVTEMVWMVVDELDCIGEVVVEHVDTSDNSDGLDLECW